MPLSQSLGGTDFGRNIALAREAAGEGLAAPYVRPAQFEEFKKAINRAIEASKSGWSRVYLTAKRSGVLNEADESGLSEFYYSHPMLHILDGWIAKANRPTTVGWTQAGRDLLQDYKSFLMEFRPWGAIYVQLQGKIAKRGDERLQPATPTRPVNPNQIRATCSVCFRNVAVTRNGAGMALHGYTRPEYGYQTRSCMGVSFPPFELSNEGTRAFQQSLLVAAANEARHAATIREGRSPIRVDKDGSKQVMPGDAGYAVALANAIRRSEGQAHSLREMAQGLNGKISSWQRLPVAGLTNV